MVPRSRFTPVVVAGGRFPTKEIGSNANYYSKNSVRDDARKIVEVIASSRALTDDEQGRLAELVAEWVLLSDILDGDANLLAAVVARAGS
jgi:hypothetical protein